MKKGMYLVLALAAMNVLAQEKTEQGWFVGVVTGVSSAEGSDSIAIETKNSESVDLDSTDSAYGIFGGFRFSNYFAVEAGYTDMGKLEFSDQTGEVSIDAYRIMAVGLLPLGKKWTLFGKLGQSRRNLSQNLIEGPDEEDVVDQSENVFSWEGGVHYRIASKWNLGLAYSGVNLDNPTLFRDDDDEIEKIELDGRFIGNVTLGLTYRF